MKFIKEIPATPETGSCELHGQYEFRYLDMLGKILVSDGCSKCAEIAENDRLQKEAAEKDEKDRKRLIDKKQSCGINVRHFDCSFDNYKAATAEQKKALQQVSDYADSVFNGAASCLVLAGSVGTGKTHLACAVANKFIENGRSCVLIKMSELIRSIKDTWRKESDMTETKIIERYSGVRLLIIDEIGIQFGSDTEKLLISEIIDNRYQSMLPTVMISNLDVAGIKSCIGDRSYDRLREDGGKVVAFNWESHRGVK